MMSCQMCPTPPPQVSHSLCYCCPRHNAAETSHLQHALSKFLAHRTTEKQTELFLGLQVSEYVKSAIISNTTALMYTAIAQADTYFFSDIYFLVFCKAMLQFTKKFPFILFLNFLWISLIAQLVKNLPAMQETPV